MSASWPFSEMQEAPSILEDIERHGNIQRMSPEGAGSMVDLRDLVKGRDILRPYGQLDVLPLYAIVSSELGTFLRGREIASRIWLKERTLLKRGSQLPPLGVEEIARKVTSDLFEVRAKMGLDEARSSLSSTEQKIWSYFPPRKLCDYFYATNHEGQGKEIDRIFYDIDRPRDMPHGKAREITRLFLQAVMADDRFQQFVLGRPFVAWTGSSFHVYLFLKKKQKHSFYVDELQYTEKAPEKGFTAKWLQTVRKKTQIKVTAGHEKKPGIITIDPSQTPSGKLARSPLGSLHMSNHETVDGVSVPVEIDGLQDQGLTQTLKEYTPERVIDELPQFSKILS